MKTVCITNFEDLMSELDKMKDHGVSAFIGCCCQPFFIKHMDDFAESGVPESSSISTTRPATNWTRRGRPMPEDS